MDALANQLVAAVQQVWHNLLDVWYILALSALAAAAVKLYLSQDTILVFLRQHQRLGILGSTALAVATPVCSCNTAAAMIGMVANSVPWAPVIAFLVASPLTSPQELIYSVGLLGWPLALTFFGISILLGVAGGLIAYFMEKTGWLADQSRFRPITGGAVDEPPPVGAGAGQAKIDSQELVREFLKLFQQLLLFFLTFTFLGNVLNALIPQDWVATLFNGRHLYAVPLAATLGLPLYTSTEASLPLVRSFIDMGMSPGAALAFMITGAGTSIGAVAGILTIARWRILAVVVGTLWVGSIVSGYTYNLVTGG